MSLTTYRNAKKYGFCPGCSHGLVLNALDKALVQYQWDPASVVLVTDIGCVGLSDQYFITSGFHGLHGRSLTYASGIKLANPELHVIALIGDGGCGIGGAHLLNAARRNLDITVLVFNNFNFGMTGGQHSVSTPPAGITATTPWGNVERPLDIAQTVALNGATYVWRGTAYDSDLAERIAEALLHPGFALLDIWEMCVAYYAATNRFTPKALRAAMDELGFAAGRLPTQPRMDYGTALRESSAAQRGKPAAVPQAIPVVAEAGLTRQCSIVVAGSAGGKVRTAARLIGVAATAANLWATQRDDYPVTVRSGHSVSEINLAPHPILYTGVTAPEVLFILSADGYARTADYLPRMTAESWLFVTPEFAHLDTPARRMVLDPAALEGVPREQQAMALLVAGLGMMRLLPEQALLQAAALIAPKYAEVNSAAVRAGLAYAQSLLTLA